MSEMNIGMKNALILLCAALAVDVVLLLERLEAADAAADDDAERGPDRTSTDRRSPRPPSPATDAAMAYCAKRSARLASLRSR